MNEEKFKNVKHEYEFLCKGINYLKSQFGNGDSYTNPTLENIIACNTLPRIEEICKRAKEKYLYALNLPMRADHPHKVEQIEIASNIYLRAINRRKNIINELNELRKLRKRAVQRMNDLKKNNTNPYDMFVPRRISKTGLPVMIYVDDGGFYKTGKYGCKCIKFKINNGYGFMDLNGNLLHCDIGWVPLETVQGIQNFVHNNYCALYDLADKKFDYIEDIWPYIIKGIEVADKEATSKLFEVVEKFSKK